MLFLKISYASIGTALIKKGCSCCKSECASQNVNAREIVLSVALAVGEEVYTKYFKVIMTTQPLGQAL